jgi:hypothetical protein
MRAKFRVSTVSPTAVEVSPGVDMAPVQTITAYPVCASSYPADGSDENNTYAKWSPSGSLSLSITNPALSNRIKEGDVFYVDFTPAPKTVRQLAVEAYHRYGAVTDFKNFRGDPMPKFDDLPETIQRAWEAAISA